MEKKLMKLNPGLAALYNILPENGLGLFYSYGA